jgi:small-conductance mechanosensitive channel
VERQKRSRLKVVRSPDASAVDRIVHHLPGDEASRRTRAKTLLRLAMAVAVVFVTGMVLWQFQATKDYASAVFASTAVVAVVIGLAAQGTLSNVVAGIVLAFSQPIRLGDRVSIDGLEGVVEELGLSYSRLRSDDGTSIEFPNALLAQKAIVSSTLRGGGEVVRVRAKVAAGEWERAAGVLRERAAESGLRDVDVVVSDVGPETVGIELRGRCSTAATAAGAERELRAAAAALTGVEHA